MPGASAGAYRFRMQVARRSQFFAPTLKEAPTDATAASHRLLVRAGFVRQLGAGIYNLLPLAVRTMARIESILREEPRPRCGLLRAREFRMKDAYSFDVDAAGLDRAFEAQRAAYKRIFARCGVPVVDVEAYSGAMGGRESVEFVVRCAAGEDTVALCGSCG